jgi:hypothetical protein
MKNEKNSTAQVRKRKQTPALDKLKRSLKRKAAKTSLQNRALDSEKFVETIGLGLSDKLGFGKYKSRTLRKIINDDPLYLVWIIDNNPNIHLRKNVIYELEPFLGKTSPGDEKIATDVDNIDWFGDTETEDL